MRNLILILASFMVFPVAAELRSIRTVNIGELTCQSGEQSYYAIAYNPMYYPEYAKLTYPEICEKKFPGSRVEKELLAHPGSTLVSLFVGDVELPSYGGDSNRPSETTLECFGVIVYDCK